jgi:hypothetical protein
MNYRLCRRPILSSMILLLQTELTHLHRSRRTEGTETCNFAILLLTLRIGSLHVCRVIGPLPVPPTREQCDWET